MYAWAGNAFDVSAEMKFGLISSYAFIFIGILLYRGNKIMFTGTAFAIQCILYLC